MFSDPEALVIVAGALAAAALITWIAARLVGRRMAERHPLLACLVTALAAPAIALAGGIVLFRIDAAEHPGADWPAMGLAGTILISQIMLVATIPTTWLVLRGRRSAGTATAITMTRDSVCMADDVHAPHDMTFAVNAADTLTDVAATVAGSSYLPMSGGGSGWTIEADGAVVAIRPGFLRGRVATLRGDPDAVMARDHPQLMALYVTPGSPWRDAVATASWQIGRIAPLRVTEP